MPPRPFYLALVLLGLPLLSGCSVIGFSLGRVANRDRVYAPAEGRTLPRGALVHVHRRSGAVVTGRLAGYGDLSEEAYAAVYTRQQEGTLPSLGAPVRVEMTSGQAVTGTFQGFVGVAPQMGLRVEEEPADARPPRTLYLQHIETFGEPGRAAYDRAALDSLGAGNRLPTRSTLVLTIVAREEHIPLQEVQRIVKPGSDGAAYTLGAIGLLVDVAALFVLTSSLSTAFN